MRACFSALAAMMISAATAPAGSWPQFRGQDGNGLAVGTAPLPTEIGPEQGVRWKTAIPAGISSPTLTGDRIFLTAALHGKLMVLCLDRGTGGVLWEREVPTRGIEEVHSIGSHAQSTQVTDGERVVSFFGSAGMFCHDLDGNLLWHIPMGPFKNNFGAGSSPILVGDKVILNQDHDTDSFLMAVDKKSGTILWTTDRSEFPRGYATPVLWRVPQTPRIVIAGTLQVKGYDLETGKEAWTVRGISRIVNMTPTVGPDGTLYVPAWSPGGDDVDRIEAPPFEDALRENDKNGNGTIEKDEVTDGPLKQRFDQIDRDKDGHISRAEHESMRNVFEQAKNVLVAIRPGGEGDITDSHVLWTKGPVIPLPYVPSPVVYNDHLFMVRNGGIVSSVNASSGEPVKKGRVSARGDFYSSPIAGDGKVFLFSKGGEASVISAEPQWKELHHADFEEEIMATPAIVDGKIFLRTKGHLYCLSAEPMGTAKANP